MTCSYSFRFYRLQELQIFFAGQSVRNFMEVIEDIRRYVKKKKKKKKKLTNLKIDR